MLGGLGLRREVSRNKCVCWSEGISFLSKHGFYIYWGRRSTLRPNWTLQLQGNRINISNRVCHVVCLNPERK